MIRFGRTGLVILANRRAIKTVSKILASDVLGRIKIVCSYPGIFIDTWPVETLFSN